MSSVTVYKHLLSHIWNIFLDNLKSANTIIRIFMSVRLEKKNVFQGSPRAPMRLAE